MKTRTKQRPDGARRCTTKPWRAVVLGRARDGQPIWFAPAPYGLWRTAAGQRLTAEQLRTFLRRI